MEEKIEDTKKNKNKIAKKYDFRCANSTNNSKLNRERGFCFAFS